VRSAFGADVSSRIRALDAVPDESANELWRKYRDMIVASAKEVIGDQKPAKKPWVTQETLAIIEQRWTAMQRGDSDEYKLLTAARRRALRRDKQMWADRLALDGEEHLRQGHSGAAFANFR